jgi:hypothetical protein
MSCGGDWIRVGGCKELRLHRRLVGFRSFSVMFGVGVIDAGLCQF